MKSGHRRTQSWCPHTGECSQVLGLEPTQCQALLHPGVWLQGLSALLVDGPVSWHSWWQDTWCPGACVVLPVCEAGTQPVPGQDLACWWVGWVHGLWCYRCVCLCLVTKSCPALCDPMNYSPPGSSVHGISQAKILEWVAMPFCRESYWLRNQIRVSCIAGRFFTSWVTREASRCPAAHIHSVMWGAGPEARTGSPGWKQGCWGWFLPKWCVELGPGISGGLDHV